MIRFFIVQIMGFGIRMYAIVSVKLFLPCHKTVQSLKSDTLAVYIFSLQSASFSVDLNQVHGPKH